MVKKLTVLFTTMCLTVCIWGQNSPEKQVEDFYKAFLKNPNTAIKNIMQPIDDDELKIAEIQNAYKKAQSNYGKCGGLDFISKKELGQSVVQLRYFFKHTRYPVIFEFIYYRNDNEWVIINFKFNDEIKALLGEKEE